jgi:hypothetical protein
MFQIWLQHVQPGEICYQQRRMRPYISVAHPLQTKVIDLFVGDVAADIGDATDHDWRFWRAAFGDNKNPELYRC